MAEKRAYYSTRRGINPHAKNYDISMLKSLFQVIYTDFCERDYFYENAGSLTAGQLLKSLRKQNLLPVEIQLEVYSEDDLFDMLEYLYDIVSMPTAGDYVPTDNWEPDWEWNEFNKSQGRVEYRQEINKILEDYNVGYELSEDGEILQLPDAGFENLFDAYLPTQHTSDVNLRIEAASRKFRRYRSSLDERRDAIRDLADVLEFLRPQLKEVLTKKDESDLFRIINGFGIRHHNAEQQTNYDKPIWYSWMFYYYLSTIHAALRLIEKSL